MNHFCKTFVFAHIYIRYIIVYKWIKPKMTLKFNNNYHEK